LYRRRSRDLSLRHSSASRSHSYFEIRADWLNATNHPDFSNATLDSSIDSATLGRFTGTSSTSNDNRIIVLGGRFDW
jgi:hypothetical protein